MKCQNPSCGHEQKTYELVFPLTLPIPTKSDVSLKDCLKLYTKEKLSTDPWYCDECNEVVDLSRKVEMWKMPQVLMVYLKRFCLKRGIHTKINDHVQFDFM
ncbi:PREDICTED: ubiquitin carboxyl-terminal hydrolase 15-like [Amphimedon queenslandica]|uniref:ubiquitinyl hydrolase 1 n=1 Tax=Amphimedon queenslandica TaxID=400682 RepID=A0AAN0JWZ7_AMPQE|nr:PREDICTED: ubiquitin carboxyl-terminal hydrolase 15-like [Amphimedon queenslandica]|eukprot:XP_019861446.1 PREDICTED: ubiquitin carboxyl-terminal hydrolase 15-like [Amphimedon queenslandica]